MKYAALRAFEKHLEEASPDHFASLYALLGKDAFHRKNALDRLLHFLQKGQKLPSVALTVLDGDKLDPSALLDSLYTPSLFSKKQGVVIHNCDKLTKTAMEKLEHYFARPASQLYLILTAPTLHHGMTFFKKLEKYGVVLDIAEEKSWEKERSLVEWILTYMAKVGKMIDASVAQALVKQVGTDGETLCQEMEKLICFVGERQAIQLPDVLAICSGISSETVWQLGEAIFRLDAANALRIGHALLDDGAPLLSLLRQIRSQFQTDLQVCALLAKGSSPTDVTGLFPYMKGSILERHCQAARHYGLQRFKEGLLKIDAAELQAKNSAPESDLFEVLLVRLTR